MLQRVLSPRSQARLSGQVRRILCGSAFTVMRGLLAGSAPLRGRAKLELLVHPFDFRDAADFWGVLDEPELAFRLHALVGGTSAYRAMCIDRPRCVDEFDDWVALRSRRPLYQTTEPLMRYWQGKGHHLAGRPEPATAAAAHSFPAVS